MKERVTVTIEKSLLKTIDASVDGIETKNRSHAIEQLLERGLKQVLPSTAVVLAGGDVRKLLKPVNGKAVVVHNIELLVKFGITRIFVVVSKSDGRMKAYLGSGSDYEVQLSYIEEKEALGTAGALHLLSADLTDTFLLLNGDEVKDIDIRDMYRFHKQQRGMGTIALTSVIDPSNYGVVLLNGFRVVAFVEKPVAKNPPSSLISAGFYILEPGVLSFVPKGFARIETDVFPKLVKEDQLVGYPFSGQYLDVTAPGMTDKISTLWRELRS